jgi:hypothetical protein
MEEVMGFRTVVMLNNDLHHEWSRDEKLGQHISRATSIPGMMPRYGAVVQCAHADLQTLAILDGYTSFDQIAGKGWVREEAREDMALKLLKEAAEKLGYRLVKKPTPKEPHHG